MNGPAQLEWYHGLGGRQNVCETALEWGYPSPIPKPISIAGKAVITPLLLRLVHPQFHKEKTSDTSRDRRRKTDYRLHNGISSTDSFYLNPLDAVCRPRKQHPIHQHYKENPNLTKTLYFPIPPASVDKTCFLRPTDVQQWTEGSLIKYMQLNNKLLN